MCAPSAPPPPDYAAAAEATAAGDIDAARVATTANRPDIYTPEYSQTWEQDPNNPDRWTGTQTLTPEQQRLFESNQRMQQGLSGLGEQAVGQVGGLFSDRFQLPGQGAPSYQGPQGQMPQYQGPGGEMPQYQGPGTFGENRERVRDAMMSRVGTDIARDRSTKEANLIAQGIPKGSEAFNREMEQSDRALTDARQQAEIAATQQAATEYQAGLAGSQAQFMSDMQSRGMTAQEAQDAWRAQMQGRQQTGAEAMDQYTTGMEGYRQSIQDALLERQTPLNEISAFRTGSQIGLPQFQAYGQQGQTQGPDLLGAAGMQGQYDLGAYSQQVAGRNAMLGGLAQLGAGMATGGTGFFA